MFVYTLLINEYHAYVEVSIIRLTYLTASYINHSAHTI